MPVYSLESSATNYVQEWLDERVLDHEEAVYHVGVESPAAWCEEGEHWHTTRVMVLTLSLTCLESGAQSAHTAQIPYEDVVDGDAEPIYRALEILLTQARYVRLMVVPQSDGETVEAILREIAAVHGSGPDDG